VPGQKTFAPALEDLSAEPGSPTQRLLPSASLGARHTKTFTTPPTSSEWPPPHTDPTTQSPSTASRTHHQIHSFEAARAPCSDLIGTHRSPLGTDHPCWANPSLVLIAEPISSSWILRQRAVALAVRLLDGILETTRRSPTLCLPLRQNFTSTQRQLLGRSSFPATTVGFHSLRATEKSRPAKCGAIFFFDFVQAQIRFPNTTLLAKPHPDPAGEPLDPSRSSSGGGRW